MEVSGLILVEGFTCFCQLQCPDHMEIWLARLVARFCCRLWAVGKCKDTLLPPLFGIRREFPGHTSVEVKKPVPHHPTECTVCFLGALTGNFTLLQFRWAVSPPESGQPLWPTLFKSCGHHLCTVRKDICFTCACQGSSAVFGDCLWGLP